MKQIHYFYKITNLINKKFYYGIRSCYCLPGKDSYMGSGRYLHNSFRKYGIENFKKEILRVCKTREDVSDLERWIVTEELVKDPNCYNQRVGGDDHDSFYNYISCIDLLTGRVSKVSKEEFHSNKDRYIGESKGFTVVRHSNDKEKNYFRISTEEYRKNKEKYTHVSSDIKIPSLKGKVLVKDNKGNVMSISANDPKYLSGELVPIWKGRRHSQESKDKIGRANSLSQKGERNSHYGTKWMTSPEGITKSVKKDLVDEYLSNGWVLGRKLK